MAYAEKTKVPIMQSQNEIRTILSKYGATAFGFVEEGDKASIFFQIERRRIRFNLPLPLKPSGRATGKEIKDYEQICRSKWRSLVLSIKAKLESVASGITTLEQEFLAHIILPNGQTLGQVAIPQIDRSYDDNVMPPLLGN